jgi:hypothetical protein
MRLPSRLPALFAALSVGLVAVTAGPVVTEAAQLRPAPRAAPTIQVAQSQADEKEALEGVLKGQIRPLKHILPKLRSRHAGKLLDASLEKVGAGRWIYHVKLLQDDGSVVELLVNAQSGSVIEVKRGQPTVGRLPAEGPDEEVPAAEPAVATTGGGIGVGSGGADAGSAGGGSGAAGPAGGSDGPGKGKGKAKGKDGDQGKGKGKGKGKGPPQ